MSVSRRTIGILSHGGTQNLGDESLFAAVIQNVRLRLPDARIVGFTMNPNDSSSRHGIPCFPVRRVQSKSAPTFSSEDLGGSSYASRQTSPGIARRLKRMIGAVPGVKAAFKGLGRFLSGAKALLLEPAFLFHSFRRLKSVELLLVSGGQQLNDAYGGPWGFPFTLFKWTVLAKWTGTKVALLSVGAGPVDSPLSKFFVRRVLRNVSYRSYRDEASSQFVRSIGAEGSHPVFPDLVYSLELPAPKAVPDGSQRVVVGTNPVPFFDGRYWPTPDPSRYQQYVNKIAKFTEWLDRTGHAVLLYPTQARADVFTIQDIRAAMNGSGSSPNILECAKIETLEDLISQISRADLIVASRYHGILISLMMNKPVLAVAYHEKCRALLEQVGQAEYAMDISSFDLEDLIERLQAMERNAPEIRKAIAERIAPFRKALSQQYDAVLALIGAQAQGASRP